MQQIEQSVFETAMVRHRLETLYDSDVLANGTPVAPALAVALDVDRRAAGRPIRAVLELDGEALDTALARLSVCLEGQRWKTTLPFGSVLEGSGSGGVRIAGQQFVLDAGRPGLWHMEQTPRAAHGRNLDLLRRLVARLTRGLACKRLGLPSPFFIVEADARDLLQFPPCPEAGGVSLQRWANDSDAERFCAAPPQRIHEMAERIVAEMRRFWKRRAEVARHAERIRVAAAEMIANNAESDLRLAGISVDLSMDRDDDAMSFYLEYEGLDEAMRRGPVLDFVPFDRDVAREGLPPPISRYRYEDRSVLDAVGASGWIDAVSAAVLAAAPEGPRAVLDRLAREYQTLIVIPTELHPLHCTLYWRNGVIRAEIGIARKLDWVIDKIEVIGTTLPQALIVASAGRRLDQVIELPFPCACEIASVEERAYGMRLKLRNPASFIDLETGRIWPDPEAEEFGR